MSASATLTKKFETLNLKQYLKSKINGRFKSNFKVPFKIEVESKFQIEL